MVNLTRIYTRTGDDGTTNLGDMSKTSKLDLRLAAYADYRAQLRAEGDIAGQDAVDRVLEAARPSRPAPLPKGMGRETLDAVVAAVRAGDGLSAAETGALIGASRITARRYLEHLAESGLVARTPRYGGTGRPELEYRWRAEG